jgi:hypothetical protein
MFTSLSKPVTLTQVGKVWPILLAALAGALFVTGSIYLFGTRLGIPLTALTGDPASVTNTPIFVGFLSNLGVIFWSGSAACALVGAALQPRNSDRFWFLLVSGIFSAVLTFDDLLMIHELILTHFFHIPERISYLSYLLLAALYLIIFLREILSDTLYPILVVSLLFFGLSVVITRLVPYSDMVGFLKDCLKFFGIIYWLVYFFNTTVRFSSAENGMRA